MPEPRETAGVSSPASGAPPLLASPDVPPAAGSMPTATAQAAALAAAQAGLTIQARSQFQMAVTRFIHHKMALVGLFTFVAILLFGTIGPLFWHYNYGQITSVFNAGPSMAHPFGTDQIGHDMFAQVMHGTGKSIEISLVVAAIATVFGTLVGAAAGYYGKWADALLMRFVDLFLIVPILVVLLVLSNTVKNASGSWLLIALILAAVLWTVVARLVRGVFLSLREREFIEAEHAIGATGARIIFRHLIPNAVGPIIVYATLTVALAILVEAALSFLGLGVQPPDTSLGLLISQGESDATVQAYLFYFPAGFLIAIILAVNFIGDGLRDALDPQQRVRG